MVSAPVAKALKVAAGDLRVGGYLKALWRRFRAEAPEMPPEIPSARPRQWLLAQGGWDIDEGVNPLLIRLCAAYVDQGVAYWSMPGRDKGLYAAVRALYGLPLPSPSRASTHPRSQRRARSEPGLGSLCDGPDSGPHPRDPLSAGGRGALTLAMTVASRGGCL